MPVLTYVDQISRIHRRLRATDLAPGPEVDPLFSELVAIATSAPAEVAPTVLAGLDATIDDLRRVCGEGETRLEVAWSHRIAAADDPWAELARFPYTENYGRLTELELGALAAAGAGASHVTVLGSGPLPLTAVRLAHEHGLEVALVELDPHHERLGAGLVTSLGLDAAISSRVGDATGADLDVSGSDVVVLAALVGADAAAKRLALSRVAARLDDGAHVVVRSSAGMRSLLYVPFEPASAEACPGLDVVLEVHPHDEVVNSVVVLRRAARHTV